jgi:hypothetical protein
MSWKTRYIFFLSSYRLSKFEVVNFKIKKVSFSDTDILTTIYNFPVRNESNKNLLQFQRNTGLIDTYLCMRTIRLWNLNKKIISNINKKIAYQSTLFLLKDIVNFDFIWVWKKKNYKDFFVKLLIVFFRWTLLFKSELYWNYSNSSLRITCGPVSFKF